MGPQYEGNSCNYTAYKYSRSDQSLAHELHFTDILGVARKCVPDPRVDPEIEALLNMLSRHSTDTVALKSAAYSLHKDGLLDILTAAKFEVWNSGN